MEKEKDKEKDKDALLSSLSDRIRKLLLNPNCENNFILELIEILEYYECVDVARQKDFLSEESDDNSGGGDYKDNYGMMTIAPSPQSYMHRGAERHIRFQQI